jgi:hypothetical protein
VVQLTGVAVEVTAMVHVKGAPTKGVVQVIESVPAPVAVMVTPFWAFATVIDGKGVAPVPVKTLFGKYPVPPQLSM